MLYKFDFKETALDIHNLEDYETSKVWAAIKVRKRDIEVAKALLSKYESYAEDYQFFEAYQKHEKKENRAHNWKMALLIVLITLNRIAREESQPTLLLITCCAMFISGVSIFIIHIKHFKSRTGWVRKMETALFILSSVILIVLSVMDIPKLLMN